MNTTDPHTLTGAYALNALEPDERAAVERHLADCVSCTLEVREFSETAARLGLAVAAQPSPALRDEVMRRIATVRQEGPSPVRAARGGHVRPRWRPVSNWALAACIAAAVALGGVAVAQYQQAEDARQQAQQARLANDAVGSVLAAADARVTTAPLRGGAVGTVVVSASRNQAVFAASGLAGAARREGVPALVQRRRREDAFGGADGQRYPGDGHPARRPGQRGVGDGRHRRTGRMARRIRPRPRWPCWPSRRPEPDAGQPAGARNRFRATSTRADSM